MKNGKKIVDRIGNSLIVELEQHSNLSQTDRIAEILKKRGSISNFEAIQSRLSLRLGARVFELRERGWQIATEQQANKDTVYRLVARPGEQLSMRL